MAKQYRLNHSRKLDNTNTRRRANVEAESLHNIPTARQRKFWRDLCARLRERGLCVPDNPYSRVEYNDAIGRAIQLLEDDGVSIEYNAARITHTIYLKDPTDISDVTRVRTKVEGGKPRRRKKYNPNGLAGLSRY